MIIYPCIECPPKHVQHIRRNWHRDAKSVIKLSCRFRQPFKILLNSSSGMKDFRQGKRLLCKLAQGNRKLCEKHFLWVSVYSPEDFSKESFPEQPLEISESNTMIAQILIHASSLNSTSNHISVDLKSVRKLELLNLGGIKNVIDWN